MIINKTFINYLLISISLLFTGCAYFTAHGRAFKRAEKAVSQSDFDLAVNECISSLKKNRSYQPAINLLEDIFPATVKKHHNTIDNHIHSQKQFHWDPVVTELNTLISLVDNLNSLGMNQTEVWLFKAEVRDYHSELEDVQINAAESHYQAGLKNMGFDDREHLRSAASEFKTAMQYSEDYKDSSTLYQQCRVAASLRLGILPFENKSGKKKYGGIGNTLSNDVISRLLQNDELMEFVDIINRDQLDLIIEEQKLSHSGLIDPSNSIELGKIVGIHRLLVGEVTQILSTKVKDTVDKKRVTKKIVIRTETYEDSEGNTRKRSIYGNVKATVRVHTINTEASVIAGYQIIDVTTAAIMNSGNLTGQASYNYEWATFSGDKRALDWQMKSLTSKKAEAPPATEQMVLQALENLTNQVYSAIKSAVE